MLAKNSGKVIWSSSLLKHIFRMIYGDNWARQTYFYLNGDFNLDWDSYYTYILLHVNVIIPPSTKDDYKVLTVQPGYI